MPNAKVNFSICFKDHQGTEYFLLQALNIGTTKDELKFVFNDPAPSTETMYYEPPRIGVGELICPRFEVSYHNDGSLFYKLMGGNSNSQPIYKNPHGKNIRRTPLSQISNWEPFVRYHVVDYSLCKKENPTNPVYLPKNNVLFDGTPFECRLFLGSKENKTPPDTFSTVSFRIDNLANIIDLLVLVFKPQLSRPLIRPEGIDHAVFSNRNVVELIERIS